MLNCYGPSLPYSHLQLLRAGVPHPSVGAIFMLIYATSKAPDLFMNEAISMNGQVIYTAIRDKPVMLHTTGHNDAN